MAFADVDSFLYIRSEPTKQSAWVGKLYPDYAAKITGPVDEWTKIQSGSVEGYVYSDYIIIGNNAEQKAQEIIEEAREEDPEEKPEEAFTYAESKEEEEARLAKEAEEARRKAKKKQKKRQGADRLWWITPASSLEILMCGEGQA